MDELKIPLALDRTGQIVNPLEAEKGQDYFCPGCNDLLILKKGGHKRPHFSHKATDNCSYETIIHKTAKRKITEIVNNYSEKKSNSPIIERRCSDCRLFTEQTLPDNITKALEEKKLPSGYVADVVLLDKDEIVAAIEIKVTHAVTKEKEANIGMPFIELSGESIVEYGTRWTPLIDRFYDYDCQHCVDILNKHTDILKEISIATEVALPDRYYRSSYTCCWKCRKLILVFCWPYELHQDPDSISIQPRTIKLRYSRTAGEEYLANTCPFCNSLQGDFFLHNEPDGPFFGFNCGDNSKESFQKDMLKLAILADQKPF